MSDTDEPERHHHPESDPTQDIPPAAPPTSPDEHQSLLDRFHAMEARLHAMEQHVGQHISKLYEHIRRIGL